MDRDTKPENVDAPEPVDALTIAQIAAAAQCDRRSVRKRLRGENVRGIVGARIDRELAQRRITAPRGAA